MTSENRRAVLQRYADGGVTAEVAADLLGPGTSVAEVVLETARMLHRLPDRQDTFTEGEFRRALAMLGLTERS